MDEELPPSSSGGSSNLTGPQVPQPVSNKGSKFKLFIILFLVFLFTVAIGTSYYFFVYKRTKTIPTGSPQRAKYFNQLQDIVDEEKQLAADNSLIILDIDFLKDKNHKLLYLDNAVLKVYDVESKMNETVVENVKFPITPKLGEGHKYLYFIIPTKSPKSTAYFSKILKIQSQNNTLKKAEKKTRGTDSSIIENYLIYYNDTLANESFEKNEARIGLGEDAELWVIDLNNLEKSETLKKPENVNLELKGGAPILGTNGLKIYLAFWPQVHKTYSITLPNLLIKEENLKQSCEDINNYRSDPLTLERSCVIPPDESKVAYFGGMTAATDKITVIDLKSNAEKEYQVKKKSSGPYRLEKIELLDNNTLIAYLGGWCEGLKTFYSMQGCLDEGLGVQKISLDSGRVEIIHEEKLGSEGSISRDGKYLAIKNIKSYEGDSGPRKNDIQIYIIDAASKDKTEIVNNAQSTNIFDTKILGWL